MQFNVKIHDLPWRISQAERKPSRDLEKELKELRETVQAPDSEPEALVQFDEHIEEAAKRNRVTLQQMRAIRMYCATFDVRRSMEAAGYSKDYIHRYKQTFFSDNEKLAKALSDELRKLDTIPVTSANWVIKETINVYHRACEDRNWNAANQALKMLSQMTGAIGPAQKGNTGQKNTQVNASTVVMNFGGKAIPIS